MSKVLASFIANLKYEAIPANAQRRTEDLFLDWMASAIAGRHARPIHALEKFAARHGPSTGPCELLTNRKRTSPLFAAFVNGASSHVVEQDDVVSCCCCCSCCSCRGCGCSGFPGFSGLPSGSWPSWFILGLLA